MDEYARFARIYDAILNPFLDDVRQQVAAMCSEAGYGRVLDICCGTARQSVFLHRAGVRSMGLDISEHMLAQAKQKADDAVSLVRGDATVLPFRNRVFDAAVLSFALHEKPLATAHAILREAGRMADRVIAVDYTMAERNLELGGTLLMRLPEMLVGGAHYRNYTEWMRTGALQGAVAQSGFSIVHQKRLFWGGAAIMLLGAE